MRRQIAAMAALLALIPGMAMAAPGSHLRAEDNRIAAITYRLATAGAGLCDERHPLTGLLFHHLAEYEVRDRPQLISTYGLDRGPGILTVLDDSPAAEAGLAAGDVLLTVNGRRFPPPLAVSAGRKEWRQALDAVEALLEEQLKLGPVRLMVLRDRAPIELTLGSVPGCPARVRLARSGQVNAFANGRYVVMTTGLLGFIQDEDELAIVIAHELAHNVLRHRDRLEAQNVPRGLLRGIGKNASRVRATEEEADRLGIRLAWAAGYDVSAAIPFWRRFYARYDTVPQLFRTHPGLRAREKLISETIAELGAASAQRR
ncbi:MAG TPA: M48 family metallopeptidase [Allosphingosinicella sp.]|jgi:hypothetical protein